MSGHQKQAPIKLTPRGEAVSDILAGILALIIIPASFIAMAVMLR
jgi:hypothetical protein